MTKTFEIGGVSRRTGQLPLTPEGVLVGLAMMEGSDPEAIRFWTIALNMEMNNLAKT